MMANRQESHSKTVGQKSASEILLEVLQQKFEKEAKRQQLRLNAQKLVNEVAGKKTSDGEEEPRCSSDGQETKKSRKIT